MIEPKYYTKIRAAQAAPPTKAELAEFDFSVLKGGGGVGASLAQSRLVHALLRRFWPVGRIGGLGWAVRHADVSDMRARWEDFNAPYGLEMRDLTGGEDFALGLQDGPVYQRQLGFMKSVMRADDLPRVARNARQIAEHAVAYSGGEIDAVEDLLVRVAVETCADYYGLSVDEPIQFAHWLMSLSTLLFADYLGDPKVRRLALAGAVRVRRVMDDAILRAHEIARWQLAPPPPDSTMTSVFGQSVRWYEETLVGRFVALQLADPMSGPSDGEIRAMLIGMAVGYVPTGGGAGGNILDVLLQRPEWLAKAHDAAREGRDEALSRILTEAMRFSPPINPGVPRYVTRDTQLGGVKLPAGATIIAASSAAMFDPRVVSDPECFNPDRDVSRDLQFGGPFIHYCIGEQLTRVLLLESFKPLLREKALTRAPGKAGQLEKTGPFPQHLGVVFRPLIGRRFQSMVTICIPVTEPVPVSVLDKHIDVFGNPASTSIAKALDNTQLVHFAHISAIAGDRSDAGKQTGPSWLIIELSVDGPPDTAIDAFVDAFGDPLLNLFVLATSVRTGADLKALLRKCVRRLVAGRVLGSDTTASGVNFAGTPELSVPRIKRDAEVADAARIHLDQHLKHHLASGSQASAAMEWVRARMQEGEFRKDLVRPASIIPAASRRADRTLGSTIASLFSDWSFSGKLVGLLMLSLLAHYVLSHGLYSGKQAGLAVLIAVRALVSLGIGLLVAWLAAAVWRWTSGAAARRQPQSAFLIEHVGTLSALVTLVGLAHFVVFYNGIGVPDWDGAAYVGRIALVFAVFVDLLTSLVVGTLVAAVVAIAIALVLIFLLRRSEVSAPTEDFDPKLADVQELVRRENPDGYAQNHIIAVTPLKTNPRWLRRLTLGLAFWGIEKLVQHRFRPGFVLDIGTIHFARWFRLPGSDKLVFTSNYDGSWESYLEDFITKAHLGQTAVWSNGVGFPKTSFLMFDGATDGAKFKRWVRRQQVPTRFWYSRYPELTTSQIRANALICEGLAKARTDSDCKAWIDLFGSAPRPNTVLEYHEIQALVFSGMGKLRAAELVPVQLPDDRSLWQGWLKALIGVHDLPGHVAVTAPDASRRAVLTFGENIPCDTAAALAFSSEGLRHMGLDKLDFRAGGNADGSTLGTFPTSFLDGMLSEARARVLGDTGESAPQYWSWAGERAAPHAVLIVYAADPAQLSTRVAALKREMQDRFGIRTLDSISMVDLPCGGGGMREPFGFNDGISQPVMRGTGRFHEGIDPIHVVAPGEFILGYGDNRGDTPPSPLVSAEHDRDLLPSLTSDLPDRFPGFEPGRARAPRDLGRNGSYLVIRQLEQDAEGFHAHVQQQADRLKQDFPGAPVTAELVAAKMVGRWPDGSSLVRHPFVSGGKPDNEFLYGVEDPQGIRCPFGAHVRRAFPRDSLKPDDPSQLSISNRHRLLRRGRPYSSSRGGEAKGLLFICLNSDIERQFEFVQQTWIASPNFHGLAGEPDPLVSSAPDAESSERRDFTIPTPSGPIAVRDIQSFVTVRNGGYFFLPGRTAILFLATFEIAPA